MSEILPWYVTSDPDHPANPDRAPEPPAPKVSKPDPGPDPQKVAADAMAKQQAKAAPVADARPSTIPDDLIPAQFQAKKEDKPR